MLPDGTVTTGRCGDFHTNNRAVITEECVEVRSSLEALQLQYGFQATTAAGLDSTRLQGNLVMPGASQPCFALDLTFSQPIEGDLTADQLDNASCTVDCEERLPPSSWRFFQTVQGTMTGMANGSGLKFCSGDWALSLEDGALARVGRGASCGVDHERSGFSIPLKVEYTGTGNPPETFCVDTSQSNMEMHECQSSCRVHKDVGHFMLTADFGDDCVEPLGSGCAPFGACVKNCGNGSQTNCGDVCGIYGIPYNDNPSLVITFGDIQRVASQSLSDMIDHLAHLMTHSFPA
ncbi:unnamed protein product [Chrysoparadoxa australica]